LWWRGPGYGYGLTEAGLQVGRAYEVPVAPGLVFQLGQILRPDKMAPTIWVACCDAIAAGRVTLDAINTYAQGIADQWAADAKLARYICGET